MAASGTKSKDTGKDEVDEMFGADAPNEDDFAGVDDFLDDVHEDDSEGWVPEKAGDGVAGIVISLGEVRSDFAEKDEDAMCPTVSIETKTGDKWRIIGYSTVLKREIKDKDPQVGDMFAVKYFGEKPNKGGRFKGKLSKRFGVAVKRKGSF